VGHFGIVESWNDGIMGKTSIFLIKTQYSNIPVFHSSDNFSNIPSFHLNG
jgi:hypothetical protein